MLYGRRFDTTHSSFIIRTDPLMVINEKDIHLRGPDNIVYLTLALIHIGSLPLQAMGLIDNQDIIAHRRCVEEARGTKEDFLQTFLAVFLPPAQHIDHRRLEGCIRRDKADILSLFQQRYKCIHCHNGFTRSRSAIHQDCSPFPRPGSIFHDICISDLLLIQQGIYCIAIEHIRHIFDELLRRLRLTRFYSIQNFHPMALADMFRQKALQFFRIRCKKDRRILAYIRILRCQERLW